MPTEFKHRKIISNLFTDPVFVHPPYNILDPPLGSSLRVQSIKQSARRVITFSLFVFFCNHARVEIAKRQNEKNKNSGCYALLSAYEKKRPEIDHLQIGGPVCVQMTSYQEERKLPEEIATDSKFNCKIERRLNGCPFILNTRSYKH